MSRGEDSRLVPACSLQRLRLQLAASRRGASQRAVAVAGSAAGEHAARGVSGTHARAEERAKKREERGSGASTGGTRGGVLRLVQAVAVALGHADVAVGVG